MYKYYYNVCLDTEVFTILLNTAAHEFCKYLQYAPNRKSYLILYQTTHSHVMTVLWFFLSLWWADAGKIYAEKFSQEKRRGQTHKEIRSQEIRLI